MTQTAESLIACCRYTLEQRLARWILMAHDRVELVSIPLTHGFLAAMLGVRRPGVTVALHMLEGERAIRSTRGHVLIRDRGKLETIAGEAYSEAIAHPLGRRSYSDDLSHLADAAVSSTRHSPSSIGQMRDA